MSWVQEDGAACQPPAALGKHPRVTGARQYPLIYQHPHMMINGVHARTRSTPSCPWAWEKGQELASLPLPPCCAALPAAAVNIESVCLHEASLQHCFPVSPVFLKHCVRCVHDEHAALKIMLHPLAQIGQKPWLSECLRCAERRSQQSTIPCDGSYDGGSAVLGAKSTQQNMMSRQLRAEMPQQQLIRRPCIRSCQCSNVLYCFS